MSLEFREGHLDGVQVWRIFRQEQEPGAESRQRVSGALVFVGIQIVENDDVAGLKRWGELRFDIGGKRLSIHGAIDDPWRNEAVASEPGDEGLCAPFSERRIGLQPFAAQSSPA